MTFDEQLELARLRAENAELRQLVTRLQTALTTALERIAEREQRPPTPPSVVKPNRPTPTTLRAQRKKRDRRHNSSRLRESEYLTDPGLSTI